MKSINIFGRKVSVVAVLIVALLVGTASAALISNYGTLTGTVTVAQTITVNEGNTEISFDDVTGSGDFTIENTNLYDVPVEVVVTLSCAPTDTVYGPGGIVTDVTGITITIDPVASVTNPFELEYDDTNDLYTPVGVTALAATDSVMPGTTVVTVTFDADSAVVPGLYTIDVEVNPIA